MYPRLPATNADTAQAWDARVTHLLTKLPRQFRSVVEWVRRPSRRAVRLCVAVFFIIGGFLAILPVFGLWMLPLGLALLSDDVPWFKVPLEKTACWIERMWRWIRRRPA